MKQNVNTIPPAQLWLGSHEYLVTQVEQYLQTILCPTQGCNTCRVCEKIRQHQHHAASWFYPEKQYSVEQLSTIVDLISLELDDNDHFFIIIQKADLLNLACANRLLKSIEEPARGYHFMLLAQRRDSILPTIRSRCTIQSFYNSAHESESNNSLFRFFVAGFNSPFEFLKELDSSKINEQETTELLDQIFAHWLNLYKQRITEPSDDMQSIESNITLIKQAIEKPPMAGSSKIFLKNLYLQLNG